MQLVISHKGAKLSVKDGSYRIRWQEEEQLLPPDKVSSIMLHPTTTLTHEVIRLAVAQQAEVLFVDGTGFPFARLWSPRFGSISTIRKNQVYFSHAPAAVSWVKGELATKLENQTALLSLLQPEQPELLPEIRAAVDKIEGFRQRILALTGERIDEVAPTLRGLEGSSGRVYFQALSQCLPEVYRFEKRSRQPAEDMFNALLNYAYGMLYGLVEGALIKAGIDPYLGIFHRDDYNRPVLAFDFIERYRVWAEYVVVHLCLDRAIFVEYFELKENGGYWLSREGKRLLVHSMNDYLHELVEMRQLSRSRLVHLELHAQAFAQELKQFSDAQPPAQDG
jgi:CRISP-associated protein Cas1